MRTTVLLALLALSGPALSQQKLFPETRLGKLFFEQTGENDYTCRWTDPVDSKDTKENPRLVAAMLNISLGLFGVHRLYLGTDVKVPVFYTLTIGGGGILWLADLGLILFSKDLSPFMDNPHVFMWVTE